MIPGPNRGEIRLVKAEVPSITGQEYSINLPEMKKLQSLTLYENTGTDISVLGKLSSLQTVYLREYGNQKITDWSPLDHVPNVTRK